MQILVIIQFSNCYHCVSFQNAIKINVCVRACVCVHAYTCAFMHMHVPVDGCKIKTLIFSVISQKSGDLNGTQLTHVWKLGVEVNICVGNLRYGVVEGL